CPPSSSSRHPSSLPSPNPQPLHPAPSLNPKPKQTHAPAPSNPQSPSTMPASVAPKPKKSKPASTKWRQTSHSLQSIARRKQENALHLSKIPLVSRSAFRIRARSRCQTRHRFQVIVCGKRVQNRPQG
ncbi:hypothetical protein HK102_007883, partial [Quaeritorhiza haematococci]